MEFFLSVGTWNRGSVLEGYIHMSVLMGASGLVTLSGLLGFWVVFLDKSMCPFPLYSMLRFHVSPLGVIMDSKRWTFYFSSHATLQWYSLCPGHYPQIRERWTCTTWNTSLPRLPFCCCIRIWLKQPITYIFNLLKNEEKFWAFQLRQSVFLQICVFIVYPPGKVWLLTDLSPKLGHRSYEETSLFWAGIPSTAFHSVSPSLSFTHLKNWERT